MTNKKHNLRHYLLTSAYVIIVSMITSVMWFVVAVVGFYILKSGKTPWTILAGLPLLLIGGGLVMHKMTSAVLAIIAPHYNKGKCVLCGEQAFKDHKYIKKILGIN